MQPKRRVFISYCHEDIDLETLAFLTFLFDEQAEDDYEVLIDRVNLQYGGSIPDFMALLETVDSVVLLLTPAYKRKTLQHKGGVHHEFSKILYRHEKAQQAKKAITKAGEPVAHQFQLVPVLFTGDVESSIPDEIKDLRYLSLVGLRVLRDEHRQFMITKFAEKTFIPEIQKIIDGWRISSSLKNPKFKEQYEALYNALFRELKAKWSTETDVHQLMLDKLFVKTQAYKKIKKQEVYFIIGRKGSGKSTITDVLSLQHADEYAGVVSLVANNFELEGLYSLLGGVQAQSDTTNVSSRINLFVLAWELLLYLACIEILVTLYEGDKLTPAQTEHARALQRYLSRLRHRPKRGLDTELALAAHFWFAFNSMIEYLKQVIDETEAHPTQYYATLLTRLSRDAFLRACLGDTVLVAFTSLVASCNQKFLITLDGFDTKFDQFRTDSMIKFPAELNERAVFENEWLESLLLLVVEIKHENPVRKFYSLLEFCITVPKDRYLEARNVPRDGYRFIGRSCSLEWTGIELAILIRKRLEMLVAHKTTKSNSAQQRLEEVHATQFPAIPVSLEFDYHGHQYRIPLFCYILRHTFWRPRDVLLHYAKILAVAKNLRTAEISVEMVRQVVKEVNYQIIHNEFIQEFRSVVSNIQEIIEAFTRSKNFLNYEEVSKCVASINFDFVIGQQGIVSVDPKIDFLYDIGFLGVHVDEEQRVNLGLTHKHAFCFNEGQINKRLGDKDKYLKARFVIHPIFVEYLRLDTSSSELVLFFDWDYLLNNEAIRTVRSS